MYLNLYQPRLVYPAGVVGFYKEFVVGIHRFIQDRGIDLAHFTKGQRKDDVAKRYLATAARVSCSSGVLRRSRTSSAPRSGSTPRRASATRGS